MIETNDECKNAWETNAKYWDNYMGNESNFFHRDLVRPYTEKFLDIKSGDFVLDIACGNGNFSKRLADFGARVIAFDFSPKMVELAKIRRSEVLDRVTFKVCDATDKTALTNLIEDKKFDKAVANMALMDISDIKPLFEALSVILKDKGHFVFSMHHPCFTFPNDDYTTHQIYKDIAIDGQPVLQNYYHRPLQNIFDIASENGFYIDKFKEICLEDENKPIIIIVKASKRQ